MALLFIRRPSNPEIVEAEQTGPGANVHPGQGQRPPRVGDWVVTNPARGEVLVMTDEEFRAQYDAAPLAEEPPPPPPPEEPEPEPEPVEPPAPADQPQEAGVPSPEEAGVPV